MDGSARHGNGPAWPHRTAINAVASVNCIRSSQASMFQIVMRIECVWTDLYDRSMASRGHSVERGGVNGTLPNLVAIDGYCTFYRDLWDSLLFTSYGRL